MPQSYEDNSIDINYTIEMLKKNLPERQCMVFDLRYEQYTIKEISQKLGYGETTIKKDLRKIKRELAFLLRT